ncbi:MULTISPECIES: serine protease [Rhodococcus]|uniref:S1 family peptidase n=1 Tax=Nocardiaceae TaxID=85025 RepID=UPI00040C2075|nr:MULTISPECIES: serine protease [Rhodococcus]WQH31203.1 serine protease [Rhodococcus fascians]
MTTPMNQHTKLPTDLRLKLAKDMLQVFLPINSDRVKAALGKPTSGLGHITPLTLTDFLQYAEKAGLIDKPWDVAFQIRALAEQLTVAGLLQRMPGAGPPPFLDAYYAMNQGATKAQASGDLWLSEVLGPEFLIRSFMASTIAVTGTNTDGDPQIGTGLLIDDKHILTNRHVVDGMTVDSALKTSTSAPPDSAGTSVPPIELQVTKTTSHTSSAGPDKHIDVAILEVSGLEGKYSLGAGIAFRDPQWSDSAWTLGYPPVPMTRESAIVVHRGEVVNPHIVGLTGLDLMLFSAIARPGNSGGPIVAQDGRVVGMVAEELSKKDSAEAPFYAGIPVREIVRALTEMGYPDLLNVETWEAAR